MKTENSIAFEKLVSARPVLIGCRRAGEVIPGFRRNLILHSGPELEFVTRFAEFQPELDYIQNHCTAATTVEELAALRATIADEIVAATEKALAKKLGPAEQEALIDKSLNKVVLH